MTDRPKTTNWEGELEIVFQENYAFLYREAKRVLHHRQDAEDVVQDLYLKLADSNFQAEIRTNAKSYLTRAVVNACLDLKRSRQRRKKDQDVEDCEIAAPGTTHSDDRVRNQLENAFASMSQELEEIVRLHCQDGYSDSEIAGIRGESRSKIASILSRSRARLKTKEKSNEA